MSELRWILLGIGVAIVIAVYLYTRYQRHAQNEKKFSAPKSHHDLIDQAIESEQQPTSQAQPTEAIEPLPRQDTVEEEPADDADSLVVLHIEAAQGHDWQGNDILEIALKAGLQKTDKNIFQYFHQSASSPIFHVANMLKPGTFDWDNMAQFKTRGLSLFMRLPTACTARESFLLMHACAQRMVNWLGGKILDQSHQPLSEAAEEEIHRRCDHFDQQADSNG